MKIQEQLLSVDLNLAEVLEIEGTLTLDPDKSVTITTSKNIIVTGKLVSRPASPDIIHTIRFIDVNEDRYQGGGTEVLDTDIGLWVMGKGQLDLEGSRKKAWTRAITGIDAGDTLIPARDITGWAVGDDIVIAPTSRGASNFDERKIEAIGEMSFHVAKTTYHPKIDNLYTPEIMNLTRNVRIEGTPGGRAHIFIHSQALQNIKYVSIRYMGPRKSQLGVSAPSLVPGRYGLHFHHCEDSTRGSVIEGVVVRDTDNHAFVPHTSHGITFLECISHNTTEDAYWWDLGHQSHDVTFDSCVASLIKHVRRAVDMDLWSIDTSDKAPTLGANGFLLGRGDGCVIKNCVVIGSTGDPHAKGGYLWPTRDEDRPEGVWGFVGNTAHNCNCGVVVWQNTGLPHVNQDTHCYSNSLDLFHGAYANSYEYRGGRFNGRAEFKAASGANRLKVIDMFINEVVMLESPLKGDHPLLFLNCKWNSFDDQAGGEVHSADIVNCEGPVKVSGGSGEVLRVQPASGQPYRVTRSGRTNISPFAPTVWGTGTGLKGEYFSDPNFQNKVFERLDINIAFGDWGNWIHYAAPGPRLSVRWTGKLLAQFSEAHTFQMGGGGSMELWLDGKKITGKVNLEAGKLYDIEVKFWNNDNNVRGGANLLWNSPGINLFSPGGEFVPSYCLYPGDATPPPPPTNEKPTANAGSDFEITLPVNSVVLAGSGNDSDGTIVNYNWQKVEGGPAVILNPGAATTAVSGLMEGNYRFRLTVTDDKGATASDDCEVIVKPAPIVNMPPSADAGPDIEYTLGVPLEGKAEDIDGEITAVKWEQVSGAPVEILEPTELNTWFYPQERGEYEFDLFVTDDKGATVSDRKKVIVK